MSEAVFATGIPFGAVSASRQHAFSRTLAGLMPQVAGVRRFGAAALDLAWVAHGRFDGYWELGIKPWDIAAGELLVREAGGYATDVGDGSPLATPASGLHRWLSPIAEALDFRRSIRQLARAIHG